MRKILLLFILIPALIAGCSAVAESPNTGKIEIGAPEPDLASGTQPAGSDYVNDTPDDTTPPPTLDNPDTPVSNGITVNVIDFITVDGDDTLTDEQKSQIEQNKSNRGYEYLKNDDGSYLMVIYAGEKSTAGYGIAVVSVEDNEGKTKVIVKETKPGSGDFVAQVITYPYTVIAFSGTTDQFKVATLEGEILAKVK